MTKSAKAQHTASYLIFFLTFAFLLPFVYGTETRPDNVGLKIVNRAGAPIDLFWVNTFTPSRPLVRQIQTPLRDGTDFQINSFDTHVFHVKFARPDLDGSESVEFTKGPKDETVTLTYDEEGFHARSATKYDDFMEEIKEATMHCSGVQDREKYTNCITAGVSEHVERLATTMEQMKSYQQSTTDRLRNYTCADDQLNTSTPIRTETVTLGGRSVEVEILFEHAGAKILVAHDFVTDEECDAFMEYGGPRLKRATVAAEDGTSVTSETRKAQQAAYNFDGKDSADPLYDLYDRVLAMTNHQTGFDLQRGGQEDFVIIQYNPSDEYGSHCDGTCDGSRYVNKGRVATAVLYCKVAERGGGTTFTKANVYVKPTKGDATFFSYKGVDGKMDDAYTTHSGCPVLEGEKWISTAWMRQGVSAEDPWSLYDPSGLPVIDSKYKEEKTDSPDTPETVEESGDDEF